MAIITNADESTYDNSLPFKMVDGDGVNLTADEIVEITAQQAAYAAQAPITAMNNAATVALAKADDTMLRIQEAVSLGATTWTTADVIAWVNYRRQLRPLIKSTTVQALPTKPAYPANT